MGSIVSGSILGSREFEKVPRKNPFGCKVHTSQSSYMEALLALGR